MRSLAVASLLVLSLAAAAASAQQPGKPRLGVQVGRAGDGVEVLRVHPDSAAAEAGLEKGDVIVSIDGRPIDSPDALAAAIEARRPGDELTLGLRRGDEKMRRKVSLGHGTDHATPSTPSGAPRAGGFLGVVIEPGDDAARIADVQPGGPAERAGLRAGDRIVAFDGEPVESPSDLVRHLIANPPGSRVAIEIDRGGEQRRLELRLAAFDEIGQAPTAGEAPRGGAGRMQQPPGERSGAKRPGWLGVYLAEGENGARIDRAVEGSPAAAAGLRAGDEVVAIEGREIGDVEDLIKALGSRGAGDAVQLTVRRGDSTRTFDITLADRPESFGQEAPAAPQERGMGRGEGGGRAGGGEGRAMRFSGGAVRLAPGKSVELTLEETDDGYLLVSSDGNRVPIPRDGRRMLILESDGEKGIVVRLVAPGEAMTRDRGGREGRR